eukprot:3432210-Pleurochrysis_carterae.AAC.2
MLLSSTAAPSSWQRGGKRPIGPRPKARASLHATDADGIGGGFEKGRAAQEGGGGGITARVRAALLIDRVGVHVCVCARGRAVQAGGPFGAPSGCLRCAACCARARAWGS